MSESEVRTPPQNAEAEASVLGAMFLKGEAIDQAALLLSEQDFYRDQHRKLFGAMLYLRTEGIEVDIVTLMNELKSRRVEMSITEVTSLMDQVPSVSNIEYYAQIVREKAEARRTISACHQAVSAVYDEDKSPMEVLADLVDGMTSGNGTHIQDEISSAVKEASVQLEEFHSKKKTYYIQSGFYGFDQKFGGWERGKLTVVLGPPKNGKTLLCLNSALQIANNGIPVGYIYLDDQKVQLVYQSLCNMLRTDMKRLTSGDKLLIPPYVKEAMDHLAGLPFFLVGEGDVTKNVDRILLWLRMAKQRRGIQVAFLDSFSILDFYPTKDKNMERVVAEAANKLVSAAATLDIALVVVSEVARDTEGVLRAKYSGRIEHACYVKYEVRRDEDDSKEFTDLMRVKAALHRGNRYGECLFQGNGDQFRIKNAGDGCYGGYGDQNIFKMPKKEAGDA